MNLIQGYMNGYLLKCHYLLTMMDRLRGSVIGSMAHHNIELCIGQSLKVGITNRINSKDNRKADTVCRT